MRRIVVLAIVSVLSVMTAQAGLLQNESFETVGSEPTKALNWEWANPDNHGSMWGTAQRNNWRSHSGSYEAAVCGSWAGGDSGGCWQESEAEGGVTYTASAWFWADGGWSAAEQGMKIEFLTGINNGETLIHAVTNTFADVGENWVQKTIQAVAPAETEWVRVVVFASDVGANGALQFDDISLVAESGTVIIISGISGFGIIALMAYLIAVFRRRTM